MISFVPGAIFCDRPDPIRYIVTRSFYLLSSSILYRVGSLFLYFINHHQSEYYRFLSIRNFVGGFFLIASSCYFSKGLVNSSMNQPNFSFYEKISRTIIPFGQAVKGHDQGVCSGMVSDFLIQFSKLENGSLSLLEKAKKMSLRYVDGAPEEAIRLQESNQKFSSVFCAQISCTAQEEFLHFFESCSDGTFDIQLGLSGKAGGHRICFVKKEEKILFFDPNLGIYYFPSMKDFSSQFLSIMEFHPSVWQCFIYQIQEAVPIKVDWTTHEKLAPPPPCF